MRLKFIFADDKSIYAVKPTGELLWNHFDTSKMTWQVPQSEVPNATPNWGSQIGIDWQQFVHVLSGGDGIIYAIKPTGELIWYRDMLRDGTNDPGGQRGWHINSGKQIGIDWQQFVHVLGGGEGIIYAVKPTGELIWYRDMLRDGSNDPSGQYGWHVNSGKQIGTDWQQFVNVIYGGNGIIYAVQSNGDLLWYQDQLRDGTNGESRSGGWAPKSGSKIGSDWNNFTHVFSAGPGELFGCYTQEDTGQLGRYVDKARNGTPDWEVATAGGLPFSGTVLPCFYGTNGGNSASVGWEAIPIEGYCWPLSGAPGEKINFYVSAVREQPYTVTCLRLQQQPDGTYGTALATPAPFQQPGRYQSSTDTAWRDGCDWHSDFTLQVPSEWPSGFYAARCTAASGYSYFIPFVVRPAHQARGDFILIANVNTWNSYNRWSGQSNYTFDANKPLSFLRPNWHLLNSWNDHAKGNHLLRGEIWVADWLIREGYRVDLYTDVDLEAGIPDPGQYLGVILSTHPEYWSRNMMTNLGGFLDRGLDLIYLGGNGMFRTVEYKELIISENRVFRIERFSFTTSSDGSEYDPMQLPLLGVQSNAGGGPEPPVGFSLAAWDSTKATPLFLKGLANLVPGAALGTVPDLNGLPCGWEVDTVLPGSKVTLLAQCPSSVTPYGVGNDLQTGIITFETGKGGFVFSACSISFGGALAVDPQLTIMVRNVLNTSLKKRIKLDVERELE